MNPHHSRRTLDYVCSAGFAFCIIYFLSSGPVPKESAIKFSFDFRKKKKKKKSGRLILAGYHLDMCPVFTVSASVTGRASK